MSAERIVQFADLEFHFQRAVFGCSHGPMVLTEFFGESPGLPAFHPRRNDRDVINASTFDRHVAADFLEALSAKKLTRSRDVLDADESVIVTRIPLFERGPNQTQS
jgi:hypothetical protein